MAIAVGLLILLLAAPAAYAANYDVGGSSGWDSGVNYDTWVSGKTFTVGDTLLFTYGSNHRVDEVNKADYDGCTTSNVLNTHSDGNTSITLSSAGSYYYICPISNHCANGMKLAITVGGSTPSTPTTPSGTPPTTGGSTPPPTTPSTNTPTPGRSGAMGRSNWMDIASVVGACLMFVQLVGLTG